MTRVARPGRPKRAPIQKLPPVTVAKDAGWSIARAKNALAAATTLAVAEPGKWEERIAYWRSQLEFAEKRERP